MTHFGSVRNGLVAELRSRIEMTTMRKKIRRSEYDRRIPDVLLGPVHPFGSLATLTAPPSELARPIALRHHLTMVLPLSERLGKPFLLVTTTTKTRRFNNILAHHFSDARRNPKISP